MKTKKQGFYMPIGVTVGTSIGVATDNLQIWLPLGITIAALIILTKKLKENRDPKFHKKTEVIF
ncbi:MAG: hypothetical protein P8J77_02495 [Flavobacteriales bacterium]|nr:hypothetical protein [Flavobacteriales bacterium]